MAIFMSSLYYSFRLHHILLVLSLFINSGLAQYASVSPTVFPLFVRSPYFNSWIQTNISAGSTVPGPGGQWPTFWTGRVLGSSGIVRVDGNAFLWHGATNGYNAATTVASYLTPTRSIFRFAAGAIQFNVTYLSPIEPSDWIRQSFPFAYMSVDGVRSTDGQSHSVQFYCDATGEWLSNNSSQALQRNTTQTSASIYHQMSLVNPQTFYDINDMAEDGTLYLAMSAKTPGMSWQLGEYYSTHQQFNTTGALTDSIVGAAQMQGLNTAVIAFSINLGDNITSSDTPFVWAMGFVRNPVIRSPKNGALEFRYSFFWSGFSNIGNAIDGFISDFPRALYRSSGFDAKIMSRATSISKPYADLVALSVRQTFGAFDITVSKNSSNAFNVSDVKIFMKDVGNGRRVNAVETLYAAFPTFLYLNNTLARAMLEPLLEFQASSQYSNPYAAPDLGITYPAVAGNLSNQAALAVENCGTMLVLVLSQAQSSGDGSLIARYHNLLKSWADYLVNNTLHAPSGSMTVDGLNGTDNSNLALKGILGIQAMSTMNKALEPYGASATDTGFYATQAQALSQQWRALAFSDHVVSTYGNQSSWGLVYNLFAAHLIKSQLIDANLTTAQSSFYTQEATSAPQYGFFLDAASQNQARSDWTVFTAAATPAISTRNTILSMIHAQAFQNGSGAAWPTEYNPNNATFIKGRASAAQGAMFAFFTLANLPISVALPKSGSGGTGHHVGVIAGGVVAGIFVIGGIFAMAFFYWRRRRAPQTAKATTPPSMTPFDPNRLISNNHSSDFHPPDPNNTPEALTREGPDAQPLTGFPSFSAKRHHSPLRPGDVPLPTTAHQAQSSITASVISTGESGRNSPSALRNEVDALRREMEAMRVAHRVQAEEPPPMYGVG